MLWVFTIVYAHYHSDYIDSNTIYSYIWAGKRSVQCEYGALSG